LRHHNDDEKKNEKKREFFFQSHTEKQSKLKKEREKLPLPYITDVSFFSLKVPVFESGKKRKKKNFSNIFIVTMMLSSIVDNVIRALKIEEKEKNTKKRRTVSSYTDFDYILIRNK